MGFGFCGVVGWVAREGSMLQKATEKKKKATELVVSNEELRKASQQADVDLNDARAAQQDLQAK